MADRAGLPLQKLRKSVICHRAFDHLVGMGELGLRHREPKRLVAVLKLITRRISPAALPKLGGLFAFECRPARMPTRRPTSPKRVP